MCANDRANDSKKLIFYELESQLNDNEVIGRAVVSEPVMKKLFIQLHKLLWLGASEGEG